MIQILIADDHAVVRQGLRQLIGLVAEFAIADEARNGWEVIERVRQGGLDLLLLDMTMPGPNGVELVKRLQDEAPRLPILILTMHGESQIAARALKAGASGYLTKDSEPEQLLGAIREVAAGGRYIAPELAARLVFENIEPNESNPEKKLSEREYQIFLMLARGRGINEIADELHLSAKTVSTHKYRLMQKLGIDTISELVRMALNHNLID